MENIDGRVLRKIIEKKIDEKTNITCLKEISSSLKLCHEEYHIIYKGIKPENILLNKDNHIKIANFKTLQIFTKKL